MIQIIRNPKIEKLEANIAKNRKTIAFHQEKIDFLEKANAELTQEVTNLKNEDMLELLSTKKLSYEQLERLITRYADGIINDEGDEVTYEE